MPSDARNMNNQKLVNAIVIFFCAFIACYVGFHNKFPLVYPDTGTYIHSGWTGEVPLDRPIVYGLFLRHISLGVSPWLVIFAQGLIASWLLFKTIGLVAVGLRRSIMLVSSTTLLTLTTGYSYNVSILIPDIFCAFTILCISNLLFDKRLTIWEKGFMLIILTFSTASHLSNLPVVSLVLAFLAIAKLVKKNEIPTAWKKLGITSVATIVAIPLISGMNLVHGGSAKISSASHVFIINHFIESGILKPFLNKNCDKEQYTLCDCKDNLSWNFIWSRESCLHDGGGVAGTREEYTRIIQDVISSYNYWPILLQKTLEYGAKQFFTFNTVIIPTQLKGTAPYPHVISRFPDAKREYISSLQNQGTLNMKTVNTVEEWLVLSSLGILIIILLYSEKLGIKSSTKWFILTVLLFSVFGSFVSANLSTVEPRYQNRVVWIFPLLVVMTLPTLVTHTTRNHE